ncbi:MAG: hypothetical protein K2X63_04655 [Burkholderiaceae bacterium]|nr:hypothetical protein [Burkholderiaceae bacterium]
MSYLEIILPFSIPPAALVPDLLRALATPTLARLLAHAKSPAICQFDDFSQVLPHEALLGGQIQFDAFWPRANAAAVTTVKKRFDTSPAITHHRMKALGLMPEAGFWFTLHPVHIHFARDHLVLTDQRRLDISAEEARVLFQEAAKLCADYGKQLLYGDSKTWFLRADDWRDMQTASKDAACGHNIEIWMAKGEPARAWRKLQNEIQMQWFAHSVNTEREARGANPVNSLWLEAGSAELIDIPHILTVQESRGLLQQTKPAKLLETDFPQHRVLLDSLIEPALNSDWALWLDAMHELEQTYFPIIEQALLAGRFDTITLATSDSQNLASFTLLPPRAWKFWVKPSLTPLFSLPHLNPDA